MIEHTQLALDLVLATKTKGYGQRYTAVLLSPPELVPFRAYLHFRQEWWPVDIDFSVYPFPIGTAYADIVTMYFRERIPPCPKHPDNWHPNVTADNGWVCFGTSLVPSGNGIVNLLEALVVFLKHPRHHGERRCSY